MRIRIGFGQNQAVTATKRAMNDLPRSCKEMPTALHGDGQFALPRRDLLHRGKIIEEEKPKDLRQSRKPQ
jgi:hypothetical protein